MRTGHPPIGGSLSDLASQGTAVLGPAMGSRKENHVYQCRGTVLLLEPFLREVVQESRRDGISCARVPKEVNSRSASGSTPSLATNVGRGREVADDTNEAVTGGTATQSRELRERKLLCEPNPLAVSSVAPGFDLLLYCFWYKGGSIPGYAYDPWRICSWTSSAPSIRQ
jgi:hypothetical protein